MVGLKSSIELAALSPSVQLCDSSLYMFSFLSVATTNLLAESGGKHSLETENILARALSVALFCGLSLLLFIQTLGPSVLNYTAGRFTPEILKPAIKFARIRSLGSPFSLLDTIAKAGCLGYRDVKTPLLSTLAAGLCNAFGDWYLVMVAGWGIFGAGLATAASEVVSCSILLRSIFLQNLKFNKARDPKTSALQVVRSMLVIPTFTQLFDFWKFAGPICLAMIGKTVSYSLMTVYASTCGVIPLAAHQVMLRFFFFFTCFGDSLSQTVQTFLPSLVVNDRKSHQSQTISASDLRVGRPVQRLLKRMFFTGLVLGQLLAGVAFLAPIHLPSLFSNDQLVWAQMRRISPFLCFSLPLHVIKIPYRTLSTPSLSLVSC